MIGTILVTGATGNVGRHLVRELIARGAPVRAFVRDPRAPLGPGVELAVGDLGDRASIAAALDGVDRVFLLTPSHPRQVEYERNVVEAAAQADVRRIVKMSTVAADPRSDGRFAAWQAECEQLLRMSRIPAVVLRSSFLMTNVLAFAESIRATGTFSTNAGDAEIAMVDPRDLATVAALALAEDDHDGRTYHLSGPEAITFSDVAAQLSEVLGRRVSYVDVPDDVAIAAALTAGAPEWLAHGVAEVHSHVKRGLLAKTSDVARVLLGREPYAFAEFARASR